MPLEKVAFFCGSQQLNIQNWYIPLSSQVRKLPFKKAEYLQFHRYKLPILCGSIFNE